MNQGQLWHEKHDHLYEKLTSDNGKRTIFLIKIALSKSASYANLQLKVWKSQNKKRKMPMRTKSKLTLTQLIIEKRNLEEIQILKMTIKILHSSNVVKVLLNWSKLKWVLLL